MTTKSGKPEEGKAAGQQDGQQKTVKANSVRGPTGPGIVEGLGGGPGAIAGTGMGTEVGAGGGATGHLANTGQQTGERQQTNPSDRKK